jgi:Zn-dependent oligopeptidase
MHWSTTSRTHEPTFDFTPEAVAAHAEATIATLIQATDDIASLPPDQVTVASTVQKLIDVEIYINERVSNLVVLLHTSPRDEIRMACGMALGQFMAVNAEQSTREDSEIVIRRIAADANAVASCTPEHKRYLERVVSGTHRYGHRIDADTRDLLEDLQDEITARQAEFGQNLDDESRELRFTAEQLEGLSDDLLATLPKGVDDQYKVRVCKQSRLITHNEN